MEWTSNLLIEGSKLRDYLLDPDHPIGGPKARFFLSCGFNSNNLHQFELALIHHVEERVTMEVIPGTHGEKRVVTGPLTCPDGRHYAILSVWIRNSDGESFRLVTAYPSDPDF